MSGEMLNLSASELFWTTVPLKVSTSGWPGLEIRIPSAERDWSQRTIVLGSASAHYEKYSVPPELVDLFEQEKRKTHTATAVVCDMDTLRACDWRPLGAALVHIQTLSRRLFGYSDRGVTNMAVAIILPLRYMVLHAGKSEFVYDRAMFDHLDQKQNRWSRDSTREMKVVWKGEYVTNDDTCARCSRNFDAAFKECTRFTKNCTIWKDHEEAEAMLAAPLSDLAQLLPNARFVPWEQCTIAEPFIGRTLSSICEPDKREQQLQQGIDARVNAAVDGAKTRKIIKYACGGCALDKAACGNAVKNGHTYCGGPYLPEDIVAEVAPWQLHVLFGATLKANVPDLRERWPTEFNRTKVKTASALAPVIPRYASYTMSSDSVDKPCVQMTLDYAQHGWGKPRRSTFIVSYSDWCALVGEQPITTIQELETRYPNAKLLTPKLHAAIERALSNRYLQRVSLTTYRDDVRIGFDYDVINVDSACERYLRDRLRNTPRSLESDEYLEAVKNGTCKTDLLTYRKWKQTAAAMKPAKPELRPGVTELPLAG